ncbi:hypothetical protein CRYUN_Cryun18bG0032100 [Craigia yunnanensis]
MVQWVRRRHQRCLFARGIFVGVIDGTKDWVAEGSRLLEMGGVLCDGNLLGCFHFQCGVFWGVSLPGFCDGGGGVRLKASDNEGGPWDTVLDGRASRYVVHDVSMRKRKDDDDSDKRRIMYNKQYRVSSKADDEYDYEDGPSRSLERRVEEMIRSLLCQVIAASYQCSMSQPQEQSTIMYGMKFVTSKMLNYDVCQARQGVGVLRNCDGLGATTSPQQRRHCLIECFPLPREIAKQAPVYCKKLVTVVVEIEVAAVSIVLGI